MITDEEAIAGPGRGSPQVAGRADQVLFELGVGGRIGLHVEVHDLLSFGHINVMHRAGQLDSFGGTELVLAGVNLFDDRRFGFRQELLGALAGDSAGTMVVPVDLRGLGAGLCHAGRSVLSRAGEPVFLQFR